MNPQKLTPSLEGTGTKCDQPLTTLGLQASVEPLTAVRAEQLDALGVALLAQGRPQEAEEAGGWEVTGLSCEGTGPKHPKNWLGYNGSPI